jgi:hypothetical protein
VFLLGYLMSGFKKWLGRRAYEARYTAGTYADCVMSIPIWTAEKIGQGTRMVLGERTPEFFDVNKMRERSEIYGVREALRNGLDTRPGALYIQSNVLALVPFIAIGMPAAELANSGIESLMSDAPELAKCAVNSVVTLGAQMATGYAGFMVNEVRTNRSKYADDTNRLSVGKIGAGFWNIMKTFWKFDLSYIVAKLGLQTQCLMTGRDPWIASVEADSLAVPLWYAVAVPLGLKGRIIETKDSDRVYGSGAGATRSEEELAV